MSKSLRRDSYLQRLADIFGRDFREVSNVVSVKTINLEEFCSWVEDLAMRKHQEGYNAYRSLHERPAPPIQEQPVTQPEPVYSDKVAQLPLSEYERASSNLNFKYRSRMVEIFKHAARDVLNSGAEPQPTTVVTDYTIPGIGTTRLRVVQAEAKLQDQDHLTLRVFSGDQYPSPSEFASVYQGSLQFMLFCILSQNHEFFTTCAFIDLVPIVKSFGNITKDFHGLRTNHHDGSKFLSLPMDEWGAFIKWKQRGFSSASTTSGNIFPFANNK